jgi:hypothetical protein
MEGRNVQLPWGQEEIQFSLPAEWQVAGTLQPAALPPTRDAGQEVRRSLAEPIGCARLRDLARPGMQVALVIDDGSRPTPVDCVLPAVLQELEAAGVGREAITMLLYAPTIPAGIRTNLPFVEFVDSPGEAVSRAGRRLNGRSQVLIFPHGGTTYPILA